MKLLVQPGDGVVPLVKAISNAKSNIEILIFRFDRGEIEKALISAVSRGVAVHALIAYTNRGGEKSLRELEMRLLAAGITVARTDDDLVRYHGKLMTIDHRELYLLAFNFTYLDMEHSRSFGVVTRNRKIVQEAGKLFEADSKRQAYAPGIPTFIVSPLNARKELSAFIRKAKNELLIYDPKVGDRAMIRLLEERARAGLHIKIIGQVSRKSGKLAVRKLSQMRLHARVILRDRYFAFIGSQSLRTAELDARREVGMIFRDRKIGRRLAKIFEDDWRVAEQSKEQVVTKEPVPASKIAKKLAKAVAKTLPPVAPVMDGVVKEVAGQKANVEVNAEQLEETVKDAVKEAVKGAVKDVVQKGVEHTREEEPDRGH